MPAFNWPWRNKQPEQQDPVRYNAHNQELRSTRQDMVGGGPRRGRHPMMGIAYTPFRERLSANDYTPYQEPHWSMNGSYQTFWRGNQLPGVAVQAALTPYVRVRGQDQGMRQMGYNASFGVSMGQAATASYLARVHQAWIAASSTYGKK